MPLDRKKKLYEIECPKCKKHRFVIYSQWWNIFKKKSNTGECYSCSSKRKLNNHWKKGQIPWNKGLVGFNNGHKPYFIAKGENNPFFGKKHSEEIKKKISLAKIGNSNNLGKHWKVKDTSNMGVKGKLHWKWIKDRIKLKTRKGSEERRSSRYKEWRKKVVERDNWKCRINNADCNGRKEVHHILGFTEYEELKYEVNNGITLCHFHHPRKINDEIRMIPILEKIVLSIVK
jgi:hypothetical protein